MATKQLPKAIVELGRVLEYPALYAGLISRTVAIYNARLRSIENKFNKGEKVKLPRHPRTLIRESFGTAKNQMSYDGVYLDQDYIPTEKGIDSSIKDLKKEFGFGKFDRSIFSRKLFGGPFLYGVAIGDFIDCRYERLQNKINPPKGSKNHSCPNKNGLRSELKSLREAMDTVFACDTAFGDCNNNAMSSGHCMLSSLIVQDMFGGDIKAGEIGGVPHYWNKVCHYEVDLTGDQFKKPKIQIRTGDNKLYGQGYRFNREPFKTMNQDFNKEVWQKHCKFRKRVLKELKKSDQNLAKKLEKATKKLK